MGLSRDKSKILTKLLAGGTIRQMYKLILVLIVALVSSFALFAQPANAMNYGKQVAGYIGSHSSGNVYLYEKPYFKGRVVYTINFSSEGLYSLKNFYKPGNNGRAGREVIQLNFGSIVNDSGQAIEFYVRDNKGNRKSSFILRPSIYSTKTSSISNLFSMNKGHDVTLYHFVR